MFTKWGNIIRTKFPPHDIARKDLSQASSGSYGGGRSGVFCRAAISTSKTTGYPVVQSCWASVFYKFPPPIRRARQTTITTITRVYNKQPCDFIRMIDLVILIFCRFLGNYITLTTTT